MSVRVFAGAITERTKAADSALSVRLLGAASSIAFFTSAIPSPITDWNIGGDTGAIKSSICITR